MLLVGWESSVGIATRFWLVRGSNSGGSETFRTRPDRLLGPPQPPVQRVHGLFPWVKAARAWR